MPRSTVVKQQEKSQTQAKNRPARSTRRDLDTTDRKIGQDTTRRMKSTGPAREALDPGVVQRVDRVVSKEKLEALRFMEEELEVVVLDSTNPTDEPFPTVWNGGICQRFQRGKPQLVKRKYVEVLARSKKTGYVNEKYKDGNGDDAYRYPSHTALAYPFTVRNDPSGDKGRAWLDAVLAEG